MALSFPYHSSFVVAAAEVSTLGHSSPSAVLDALSCQDHSSSFVVDDFSHVDRSPSSVVLVDFSQLAHYSSSFAEAAPQPELGLPIFILNPSHSKAGPPIITGS